MGLVLFLEFKEVMGFLFSDRFRSYVMKLFGFGFLGYRYSIRVIELLSYRVMFFSCKELGGLGVEMLMIIIMDYRWEVFLIFDGCYVFI